MTAVRRLSSSRGLPCCRSSSSLHMIAWELPTETTSAAGSCVRACVRVLTVRFLHRRRRLRSFFFLLSSFASRLVSLARFSPRGRNHRVAETTMCVYTVYTRSDEGFCFLFFFIFTSVSFYRNGVSRLVNSDDGNDVVSVARATLFKT